jgi:shikimate dehydrogenase
MIRALLGVAGWPVGHSRSPAMHNAALAELALDWLYVPVPLAPARFEETVRALPASGFRGLNVTVPHKQAAAALADDCSAAVEAIGAANTLTFADGRIAAENTDAGGFLDALGESPAGRRALVLGAGGSARAIVWALREAGAAEVSVWNRTSERAAALADALEVRHVERPEPAELVVNCTSVGLGARVAPAEAAAAVGLDRLDPPSVLVDLVYGDEPSPLTDWATARGGRVVDGLEVLVHQGARSLAGWTGFEVSIETMRTAARSRPARTT